ncbi:RNA-guided endonuclease InsQ/TnpB family protein [Vibrio cholerae]
MKIEKAYKFKLEPTSEQAEKLAQMAGCGRVVFNDSLEYVLNIIKKSVTITDKKVLYKHLNDLAFKDRKLLKKSFPNSAFLNKQLTSWKKLNHRLWLDNAFTDCLQQRQRDFVKALDEWSKGKRGFPVFRARKIAHHSTMRFPAPKKQISIQNKYIKLPNGLGLVRYRNSQPVIGELRNATVSLNAVGEWHISIMCLVEIELSTNVQGEITGIDMGIAKNMTLSTDFCGNEGVFEGFHSFRAYQDKLAIEQRKLSRKVLGSENWKKQKLKVSKLHQRIANIRKDYQHKATSEISKNQCASVATQTVTQGMSHPMVNGCKALYLPERETSKGKKACIEKMREGKLSSPICAEAKIDMAKPDWLNPRQDWDNADPIPTTTNGYVCTSEVYVVCTPEYHCAEIIRDKRNSRTGCLSRSRNGCAVTGGSSKGSNPYDDGVSIVADDLTVYTGHVMMPEGKGKQDKLRKEGELW